jgi:hypothetical protein
MFEQTFKNIGCGSELSENIGQLKMKAAYCKMRLTDVADTDQLSQFFLSLKKKEKFPVKYAMHIISSKLFVYKYQLYLPNEKELRNGIESFISREDNSDE